MSRFDEVTEAIYQRFEDLWVVGSAPRSPFVFGNEAIDPPDGPWIRLWVRGLPSGQETLGRKGNRKFNRPGLVTGAIRQKPGTGTKIGIDLGEALREIFEGERLPIYDLRFNEFDVSPIGEIEDGRWWATAAEGRFEYTDIK